MIVTVTGYKGGIGKTTTALHLAAYLQQQAPAVLVDGDLNRSATGWGRNGSLPFRVVDERQAAKVSREFEHIVIDTAARPVREDLEALVAGCDHLIIPTTPDALALDALVQTVGALEALGATNYRVLLTIVPPARHRMATRHVPAWLPSTYRYSRQRSRAWPRSPRPHSPAL